MIRPLLCKHRSTFIFPLPPPLSHHPPPTYSARIFSRQRPGHGDSFTHTTGCAIRLQICAVRPVYIWSVYLFCCLSRVHVCSLSSPSAHSCFQVCRWTSVLSWRHNYTASINARARGVGGVLRMGSFYLKEKQFLNKRHDLQRWQKNESTPRANSAPRNKWFTSGRVYFISCTKHRDAINLIWWNNSVLENPWRESWRVALLCTSVSKQSKTCGRSKKELCIGADNVTNVSTFKNKLNWCSNASWLAIISLYSSTF